MNKAIFLDRDGIINVDKSYVYKIEDFEFCEGIFAALKHFQNLGFLLILITNQSGIGRKYYTSEDFSILSLWMSEQLKQEGIFLTDIFYCPHSPEENCTCRKPKPQMLLDAIAKYNIDPKASWIIGDKPTDIEAGKNAGIAHSIFVNNLPCKDAKYSVKSIFDTINLIQQ